MATAVIIGLGTAFGIYATKLYYKGSICQARRDLTGQVAIITGGSTGIGRETALDLAKEHCTVVIAARDLKKLQ
jgi:5,10-methylene-tetrahydrofolate dehydrogenase/methenyl tetrahydrofolate cyclohydrolase